jgi:hypothetical protein
VFGRGVNRFNPTGGRRFDSLTYSRARLARLLELATIEEDPMKSDEFAAEIRRVLDEREFLRNRLGITNQTKEGNQ